MAVTSGKTWREQTYEIELPSGNTVRLRPLSGAFLINTIDIPDWLTSAVAEAMNGGTPKEFAEKEGLRRYHQVLDAICRAMFVSPRIVDDPQADDEIAITDIDDMDKTWVYFMVGKGASQLRTFRHYPKEDVVGVADVSGNGGRPPVENPEPAPLGE